MLRMTDRNTGRRQSPARLPVLFALLVTMGSSGCMTEVVEGRNDYIPEHHLGEQALARRDLGVEYLSTGRVGMALRELLAAYDYDPEDPITLLWLGEGYRRRGHDDRAMELMQRALEVNPEYQGAHLNLSGFYLQLERWEDSLVHSQYLIDDAIFERPQLAYSNKGWALFKLGRISEARENFVQSLRMKRNYWPADLNLGILEDTAGHDDLALRHFERVLRRRLRSSASSETNFRLAKLHVGMGNRVDAIEHFNTAVSDDPDGNWADQSREFLKMLQ